MKTYICEITQHTDGIPETVNIQAENQKEVLNKIHEQYGNNVFIRAISEQAFRKNSILENMMDVAETAFSTPVLEKKKTKLKLEKEEDEWIVGWYEGGKRNNTKSYYTDSKKDAMITMKDMQKEIDGKQSVKEQSEYSVLAKGISDEETAKRIAQDKQGRVVSDEEDEDKFMVIKNINEKKNLRLREQIENNEFVAKTKVSLLIKDVLEYELITETIDVKYTIKPEIAQWGYNGIDVAFEGKGSIQYEVDGEMKSVDISFSQVDVEWNSGEILTPEELDLYLTKDGVVDTATLYCSFWDPTY